MTMPPQISIITVNLNNLDGLKRTMQSVFEQTLPDYEFVIIDGGSSDGSKDYIGAFDDRIHHWVSEPDKGVFSAMNKGIRAATGEYLLFLNSGDSLENDKALQNVAVQISDDYEIYYGDVRRLYSNGDEELKKYPETLTFNFFLDSALGHQSVFIKRALFSTIFFYNENLKITGDWEFLICAICKFNVPYKYLGLTVSNYDMSGISNLPENKYIIAQEREKCYQKYFPLFIEDYSKMEKVKKFLSSPRTKMFRKVEEKKATRKLNYWFLRLLNKFL